MVYIRDPLPLPYAKPMKIRMGRTTITLQARRAWTATMRSLIFGERDPSALNQSNSVSNTGQDNGQDSGTNGHGQRESIFAISANTASTPTVSIDGHALSTNGGPGSAAGLMSSFEPTPVDLQYFLASLNLTATAYHVNDNNQTNPHHIVGLTSPVVAGGPSVGLGTAAIASSANDHHEMREDEMLTVDYGPGAMPSYVSSQMNFEPPSSSMGGAGRVPLSLSPYGSPFPLLSPQQSQFQGQALSLSPSLSQSQLRNQTIRTAINDVGSVDEGDRDSERDRDGEILKERERESISERVRQKSAAVWDADLSEDDPYLHVAAATGRQSQLPLGQQTEIERERETLLRPVVHNNSVNHVSGNVSGNISGKLSHSGGSHSGCAGQYLVDGDCTDLLEDSQGHVQPFRSLAEADLEDYDKYTHSRSHTHSHSQTSSPSRWGATSVNSKGNQNIKSEVSPR